MSGAYERQAANVTMPTTTYSDSFPSTGVNTGGLDLGAIATGVSFLGQWIWIKSDQDVALRTGAAAVTATVGDIYLTADVDYGFRVNKATRFLSVFGKGTAGTLYIARSDGPPA